MPVVWTRVEWRRERNMINTYGDDPLSERWLREQLRWMVHVISMPFSSNSMRQRASEVRKVKDNTQYNPCHQTNEASQRDRTLEIRVQQKTLQRIHSMHICYDFSSERGLTARMSWRKATESIPQESNICLGAYGRVWQFIWRVWEPCRRLATVENVWTIQCYKQSEEEE